MRLRLLILPSTGPVLHGKLSAARTASMSRRKRRANEAMALPSAWVSHGSRSLALRSASISWKRQARSAASAIAGEAARTALKNRTSSLPSFSLNEERSLTAWRVDGGFQPGPATDGAGGDDRPSRSRVLTPRRKLRTSPRYVRQSPAHQVLHNHESSTLQHAMRGRLTTMGWSHIGRSTTILVDEHRIGYAAHLDKLLPVTAVVGEA